MEDLEPELYVCLLHRDEHGSSMKSIRRKQSRKAA